MGKVGWLWYQPTALQGGEGGRNGVERGIQAQLGRAAAVGTEHSAALRPSQPHTAARSAPHAVLLQLLPHVPLVCGVHLHARAPILGGQLSHRVRSQHAAGREAQSRGGRTRRVGEHGLEPGSNAGPPAASQSRQAGTAARRQAGTVGSHKSCVPEGAGRGVELARQHAHHLTHAQVRVSVHHDFRRRRHPHREGLRACKEGEAAGRGGDGGRVSWSRRRAGAAGPQAGQSMQA